MWFFMLPKTNRLKKKKDFEKVIKLGRGASGDCLSLRFLFTGARTSRVGFVVSKKVSNKAVLRNKAKRALREIIRECLPELKHGYDIIFFTQRKIVDMNFEEIKQTARAILTKAKLLN